MSLEQIHEFLGWCTVLNAVFFLLALVKIRLIRNQAVELHNKIFRIDEASLHRLYLQYFIVLKAGFLIFNLTPYLALHLIT